MSLLGIVLLSAGGWVLVRDLPTEVVLAGAAPAILFSVFLLRPRWSADLPGIILPSLLLGAVIAAPLAAHLNQYLADVSSWETSITRAAIAPMLEELVKLSVLALSLLWRPWNRTASELIRRGALVGLGFAAMENTQYLLYALIQGGYRQMALALYVRGALGGLQHAMYGALGGASLALVIGARSMPRSLMLLALAVMLHVVWNSVIAGAITQALCDETGGFCRPFPDWVDLLAVAPAGALVSLVPGALVLQRVRSGSWKGGDAAAER